MTTHFSRAFLGLTLALGLSACGAIDLNPAEKTRLYKLEPTPQMNGAMPVSPAQLVIEVPATSRSLDTDRIAVQKGGFELSYYSGVRWSDRTPRMLQTYLLEAFENSGSIMAVGRQAVGLGGNYALKGELWDFQVELGSGEPTVTVRFNAKLIEQPAARIISSRTFRHSARVPSGKFDDLVAAFNESLNAILPDLVAWTLTDMEAHRIEKERKINNMMSDLEDEREEASEAVRIRLDSLGEAPGHEGEAGEAEAPDGEEIP